MDEIAPDRRRGKPGDEHPGSRRETRELSRSVIRWMIIVGNVALLGLFALVMAALLQPPSDETVGESFARDRTALERIRAHLQKKSDSPDDASTLQSELEEIDGIEAFLENGDVHVVLYSAGSESDRVRKGVIHTQRLPHPVVENTDTARKKSSGPGRAHAHLADGWYIEYTWSE